MSTTIRPSTRADLLALPAILLGFQPHNSCVVVALRDRRAYFCARIDLDWHVEHRAQVTHQMRNALRHLDGCGLLLLGYGPYEVAAASVERMADVLGFGNVWEALVADGGHYWSLLDDGEEGDFDFASSSVAAEAIYQGMSISADRGSALAPIETSAPASEEAVEDARDWIDGLDDEAALTLLESLVMGGDPLDDEEALALALLIDDEERMSVLLGNLSRESAPVVWPQLVAARRVAPPPCDETVLALLGVASWLDGRGAAFTSCLEQLSALNPHHPLMGLLVKVHLLALPPRRWDE